MLDSQKLERRNQINQPKNGWFSSVNWRRRKGELYLKGIYPVEVIALPDEGLERRGKGCLVTAQVRAKNTFLFTSNYSKDKRWVRAGEVP
jgi:hypothetical protein